MSDEFNELVVTPVKSQEQAAEVMDSARRGIRRSGYGRGIHGDHRFGSKGRDGIWLWQWRWHRHWFARTRRGR